ncbi:MAG: HAD family hydrolase [Alphaproteobacteria bacterium]|nr:HAD family hydrolase [Alphaproteobacteria bacterium]
MTPPPRPAAILFDLDDTLISYSGERREAWAETLAPLADRLGGRGVDDVFKAMDAEMRWFWSEPRRHREGRLDMQAARLRICAGGFARLGIADAALTHEVALAFHANREKRIRLFDDAHRVLDTLKASGFRLGLITNGEAGAQRGKVERFELGPRFHHIQIEGELGLGKPEPAAYAHALGRLEATAAETWIVGDNLEWEVAVPQRLGFARAIWFDGHGRGLPAKSEVRPTHSLGLLRDLLPMVGLAAV